MIKMKWAAAWILFLALCVTAGMAQMAKPSEAPTSISGVLDRSLKGAEGEFVSAADAMPEDKYSFAPTAGEFKGVRTFAQQVKHVAAVNYMLGAALLEEKIPVDTGG